MSKPGKLLVLILVALSCSTDETLPDLDFRMEMREFVQRISTYAKGIDPDFQVIPQNGQELLTTDSEADGPLATSYVNAIDAVGREDLFYGYTNDDMATPPSDRDYLISFCDIAITQGIVVLVTDYCSTPAKMDDSYAQNETRGYVAFAADHRELDNIPSYPSTIYSVSDNDISTISEANNFLYLINPSVFSTKQNFLDAIIATNYDLILIDLFYDDQQLTSSDVASLKVKANGGNRLVIAYMSIGEAEDYRYYWDNLDKDLIHQQNPDWPGNYLVKYWEADWQGVIYGNDQSYTKKIIEAGFDGIYLDIIEAYESFE